MAVKRFKVRLAEFGKECDDPVEDLAESLRGAPGVQGIAARVVSAAVEGDDLVGVIEANPRDYVRQCIAFSLDAIEVLADLKKDGMSAADLAELIEWLRGDPDLKVAVIQTEDGELRVDEYPTKADI